MRALWFFTAAGLVTMGCAYSEQALEEENATGGGPVATGGAGVGGRTGSGGVATGGLTHGGATGTGGDSNTGGLADTGGHPATGGIPGTGGTPATGGAAPTGGAPANGGASPEGGTAPVGGAHGGAHPTGGASPAGGAPGGASATGGTPPTGGAAPDGGASPTGGTGAVAVECDEASAVDLGEFNSTGVAVPTDACAKITKYPSWWQGLRGTDTELGTTANGTGYPVPFTWDNSCSSNSGSGSFSGDWTNVNLGDLDSSCTTLFDLGGSAGSTIYLRFL